MYTLNVPVVINGNETIQEETVYNKEEIPFTNLMIDSKRSKKRIYRPNHIDWIEYLEIPSAFDIETTNIYKRETEGKRKGKISKEFRPYAFMYHWQFCIDTYVVFGRRWEEYISLLTYISNNMNLSYSKRLVVWVHNLSFEFQFMRRFIDSGKLRILDGFYKEKYTPLKVVLNNGIEFRCSSTLSNMTLSKFCENERNVIHFKLSGDDYDYDKLRTPDTPMLENELAYCYNDVRGLCECILSRMENDTLAKMPMTATGYVRRDCRSAMRKHIRNRELFEKMRMTKEQYLMCKDVFRGGDTHANAKNKGVLWIAKNN